GRRRIEAQRAQDEPALELEAQAALRGQPGRVVPDRAAGRRGGDEGAALPEPDGLEIGRVEHAAARAGRGERDERRDQYGGARSQTGAQYTNRVPRGDRR